MGCRQKSFLKRDGGQVAVTFALVALPLLAVTTASVDFTSLMREKQSVKGALDAAVLAAVNNNAIELSAKGDYAEAYFRANYDGAIKLELTPSVEENEVKLAARGEKELLFGNLVGISNPVLGQRSGAVIATENTICLMALNETDVQSIWFDGGIQYSSPSCSVYSNSTDGSAITSTASQVPIAKSFCAVGGVSGSFEPYAKGECRPLADPYETTAVPDIPSHCAVPFDELVVLKPDVSTSEQTQEDVFLSSLESAYQVLQETGNLRSAVLAFFQYQTSPLYDADANQTLEISENRTGSYVDVKPGTFCGGLTIDGIEVEFMPGEYIIKDGPLSFINGAEATAKDVTFILAGDTAVLNVQSKSILNLKAPSEGDRQGLAVMEVVDNSQPGNRPVQSKRSLIASGGTLTVAGTVYLPQQTLEIRGQGTSVGSLAPATSFIADKLYISGSAGATMVVDVDHQAEGVPPIQPRAEDGIRLTE